MNFITNWIELLKVEGLAGKSDTFPTEIHDIQIGPTWTKIGAEEKSQKVLGVLLFDSHCTWDKFTESSRQLLLSYKVSNSWKKTTWKRLNDFQFLTGEEYSTVSMPENINCVSGVGGVEGEVGA